MAGVFLNIWLIVYVRLNWKSLLFGHCTLSNEQSLCLLPTAPLKTLLVLRCYRVEPILTPNVLYTVVLLGLVATVIIPLLVAMNLRLPELVLTAVEADAESRLK